VVGATSTTAQPLAILSCDATLIGEEIYAAEAYLASAPSAKARLLSQDALRTVFIVALVLLLLVQPLLAMFGIQISL
jgi:hypothetical protein